MAMSLNDFREALLDRLLTFLWRQWSALGVLGDSSAEESWIIDPEALLIFSLPIARYEPRLFDEILAWLLTNGERLDASRLRQLLSKEYEDVIAVIGGALRYIEERGQERKWKNLAAFCHSRQVSMRGVEEPLFKERSGIFHPRAEGDKRDPAFAAFGLNRLRIKIQKPAKEVPVNARANLRFLLRALFGAGAKSEALLYLMTHESAHPREIAEAVGLFWLSLHQALLGLAQSGLVLTKPKGKKLEYWLSQRKWWEFLASTHFDDGVSPKWLDWIAIFKGLENVWKTLDDLAKNPRSDYMASSKLQDSLEFVAQEFARAGFDVPIPKAGLTPQLHQRMALRFLGKIIGLENEADFAKV